VSDERERSADQDDLDARFELVEALHNLDVLVQMTGLELVHACLQHGTLPLEGRHPDAIAEAARAAFLLLQTLASDEETLARAQEALHAMALQVPPLSRGFGVEDE